MTSVAASHGYGAASVARVIERAGVSRATFYEHFADREACFLAAYRTIASEIRASMRTTAQGNAPADRLRAVIQVLLRRAADDPGAARLVLVESLTAGAAVRSEYERQVFAIESSIERFLAPESEAIPALHMPARALLGGLAGVLSMCVLSDRLDAPSRLLEELLVWIESYELESCQRHWKSVGWSEMGRGLSRRHWQESSTPARRSPRGRNSLPPSDAAAARRERILAAMAQMTAIKGYSELTVADIVATARITRGAFYSHFRGKEDAFLAAQTVGFQGSIAAAASEFFVPSSWPERVWAGLTATLGYVAAHPHLGHLGLVEVQAAGRTAIQRDYDIRMAYVMFLEDGYSQRPQARHLPRLCSEAIGAALFALMRRQVLLGRTEQMLEVLPQCAYVALAPFIGPADAMTFVEARSQSASRASRTG